MEGFDGDPRIAAGGHSRDAAALAAALGYAFADAVALGVAGAASRV